MQTPDQGPRPPMSPRAAMRVIALALILGQVLFAAVVLWLLETRGPLAGDDGAESLRVLSLIAIVFAVLSVPMAFVLRGQVGRRLPGPQGRQAAFLAFMAILEGAGLLNLVTWLLLGPVVAHPLAAGALLAVQVVVSVMELKTDAT